MTHRLSCPNVLPELLSTRVAVLDPKRARVRGRRLVPAAPDTRKERTAASGRQHAVADRGAGSSPRPPGRRGAASPPRGVYSGRAMALCPPLRSRPSDVSAEPAVLLPISARARFPRRALHFSLAFAFTTLGGHRPSRAGFSPALACFSGGRGRSPARHGAARPRKPTRAAHRGGLRAGKPSLLRGRAPRAVRRTPPPGIAWELRAFVENERFRDGGFVQHRLYEIRLSPARGSL